MYAYVHAYVHTHERVWWVYTVCSMCVTHAAANNFNIVVAQAVGQVWSENRPQSANPKSGTFLLLLLLVLLEAYEYETLTHTCCSCRCGTCSGIGAAPVSLAIYIYFTYMPLALFAFSVCVWRVYAWVCVGARFFVPKCSWTLLLANFSDFI